MQLTHHCECVLCCDDGNAKKGITPFVTMLAHWLRGRYRSHDHLFLYWLPWTSGGLASADPFCVFETNAVTLKRNEKGCAGPCIPWCRATCYHDHSKIWFWRFCFPQKRDILLKFKVSISICMSDLLLEAWTVSKARMTSGSGSMNHVFLPCSVHCHFRINCHNKLWKFFHIAKAHAARGNSPSHHLRRHQDWEMK